MKSYGSENETPLSNETHVFHDTLYLSTFKHCEGISERSGLQLRGTMFTSSIILGVTLERY